MIASAGESVVNPSPMTNRIHRRLTRCANNTLMFKTILIFVLLIAGVLVWIGTRPAAPKPFSDDYQRALRAHPGSEFGIEAGLEEFAAVYGELTHPEIGRRVARLYADVMYFNDSLKTFQSRQQLVAYMQATARMLDESTVEIDQVLRDGNDVFVRWTMTFASSAMGRKISSESIGMTHLRFNPEGRIVLHQDFWDSAAGLYRNLPVIGYALKKVDQNMAD